MGGKRKINLIDNKMLESEASKKEKIQVRTDEMIKNILDKNTEDIKSFKQELQIIQNKLVKEKLQEYTTNKFIIDRISQIADKKFESFFAKNFKSEGFIDETIDFKNFLKSRIKDYLVSELDYQFPILIGVYSDITQIPIKNYENTFQSVWNEVYHIIKHEFEEKMMNDLENINISSN